MKTLIAIACLALSMGCASLGSMPSEDTGPLRAYLLPHTSSGDVSFHVSKAAYVAVFRIVPGRGTSMVYPYSGASARNSFAYSGFHSLGFGRRNDEYAFASYGMGAPYGPELYFMIASEEPLRLEQFGAFGSGMNTAFGNSFAFNSGHFAMERLVELAVPNPAGDSWTTDYYVHWPEEQGLSRRRNRAMVQISCNGVVYQVPALSAAWAAQQLCGGIPQTQPTPPPAEPGAPPAPETPQDSIVEPRRRPPVAPAERISSSQLTEPEIWEQLRGFAEEAAVTRGMSARESGDSDDFGRSDGGIEAVNRAQPRTRSSSDGQGSRGSSDESPRSRPAPETASTPSAPSAERERPSGSDGGSVERPLAPIQPE